MILVTVGTEQYPFNALFDWIEALMRAGFIALDEEVIVQYGASTRLPDRAKIYRHLPEPEFKTLVSQARLVIAHCGEGTALLLKHFDTPYILVPRTQRFGEHVDDHQLEMAAALEKQGVAIARSPADLVRFLSAPTLAVPQFQSDAQLCAVLSQLAIAPTQRVMLVCSAGGHFKAMQGLQGFWRGFAERTWVTFQTPATESDLSDQGDRVYWAYHPTNRNLPNLVRNLVLAVGILRQARPTVLISTGAGVAVPFLLLAKILHGSTIIFVESKTRLQKLSLSARMLRVCGVIDHLIIQSQALSPLYPEAIVVDNIADDNIADDNIANDNIADAMVGQAQAGILGPQRLSTSPPASPKGADAAPSPTACYLHKSVLLAAPTHQGEFDATTFVDTVKSAFPGAAPTPQVNPAPLVNPVPLVIVDMQRVQCINSEGLDSLLRAWRWVAANHGQFALWSLQPGVLAVLKRARFDRWFTIDLATTAVRQSTPATVARPVSPSLVPQSPWRRTVDIGAGLVGLWVTALLFLPIALAIKLESEGPIFTSEMRLGYMGQRFSTWKFRTTHLPSAYAKDGYALAPLTEVGKLLRTLKLDKLPLFWNVLVGDMRLLGAHAPRFQMLATPSLGAETPDMQPSQFMDSKPGILVEWAQHLSGAALIDEPIGNKVLDTAESTRQPVIPPVIPVEMQPVKIPVSGENS